MNTENILMITMKFLQIDQISISYKTWGDYWIGLFVNNLVCLLPLDLFLTTENLFSGYNTWIEWRNKLNFSIIIE